MLKRELVIINIDIGPNNTKQIKVNNIDTAEELALTFMNENQLKPIYYEKLVNFIRNEIEKNTSKIIRC